LRRLFALCDYLAVNLEPISMARTKSTPAKTVVDRFAEHGITIPTLAAGLNVNRASIYRWMQPKSPRKPPGSRLHVGGSGCGGIIPAKYHAGLLAFARKRSVPLAPEELVAA
jgi:hypothetical protein